MSRRVSFASGEYYHLYNRGVEKRTIYLDQTDYRRFSHLLYLTNSTKPIHLQKICPAVAYGRGRCLARIYRERRPDTFVDILAYCMMPNHFHLLVRAKEDCGVSKFMQKLCTGYTMYFNRRHRRGGTLFQGKFQSTHADTDEYLKYLYAYIHLNPMELLQPDWKENRIQSPSAAKAFLDDYHHSSYLDYGGVSRTESVILNKEAGPGYFTSVAELESEMRSWLTLQSRPNLDWGKVGQGPTSMVAR